MENNNNKTKYVWVIQQKSGDFVVGYSFNAARSIAYFNSGRYERTERRERTIARVIGVKPVNEERSVMGVYEKFKSKYGDKVRLLK